MSRNCVGPIFTEHSSLLPPVVQLVAQSVIGSETFIVSRHGVLLSKTATNVGENTARVLM